MPGRPGRERIDTMVENTSPEPSDKSAASADLGTFAGVFTPSILTILGIILFLRLGYVVGNTGLRQALIIIGLANTISILTSVSLAAIATNLHVKGGGDYYLISRTLGVAYGGAIGLVLFLAQSVSIGFYCTGFGEVLTGLLPVHASLSPRIIAAGAVAFLFIFAWLGADWATRFQYLVMTLLAAALASFYWGAFQQWDGDILSQNWTAAASQGAFWLMFAIFFPAVTGFTQGVSMSGDLKEPGKSLPRGTFTAVVLSMAVYFSVAILLAAAVPRETLGGEYGSMGRVARFRAFIDAGVIAATLSSAMASFLGAPRILQSLAADRIFPFLVPFAKVTGSAGNPRRGVLLSTAIALLTVSLGNLNLIAPVVSMFFLISYGLLNYATFFEARTASPGFRPRFRWFDYRLSLLGFLACLAVMLAIDMTTGIVAVAILFAIYHYLKRTVGPPRWADSRRAYHLQRVRQNLLEAAALPEHDRNWRPQMLALASEPESRARLLQLAAWLEGGSGLTTVVQVLEGEGLRMLKRKAAVKTTLKAEIAGVKSKAFPLVMTGPRIEKTVETLVQAFGIGPLAANTFLLHWPAAGLGPQFAFEELRSGRILRIAFRHGCNGVVLESSDSDWQSLTQKPAADRVIDVWWYNDASGRLMLLLAYLMTRHADWNGATIRLLSAGGDDSLADLGRFLEAVRIDADPRRVALENEDQIAALSASASLVFLPFQLRRTRVVTRFGSEPRGLLLKLPTTVMVMAAEDIDLDAEPEEGEAGEAAAALDAYTEAEKKFERAEEEAAAALAQLAAGRSLLETTKTEALDSLKAAVEEAELQAAKLARRAAKAKAKLTDAARDAKALGVVIEEDEDAAEQRVAEEKENLP
jgi:amino acid transporter